MTMSNEQVTVTRETRDRLRELRSKATPGPYRAHDHNDMARLGEDPVKWLGYAWVGRITKQSEPDGRFDAGWLDRDSRGDACKEYRMRASADAHFVAEALNALPDLLDYIDTLEGRLATQSPSSDIEAAVEALSNLIALARPHFSDPPQMLALEQAEAALAALKETPDVG